MANFLHNTSTTLHKYVIVKKLFSDKLEMRKSIFGPWASDLKQLYDGNNLS